MPPPIQPAVLSFAPDGTPYSPVFDDVYHTSAGGLGQARHVFLGGNDLPERWRGRQRWVIVETGFGLGNNFLATWDAWRRDAARCERFVFVSSDIGQVFQSVHLEVLKRLASSKTLLDSTLANFDSWARSLRPAASSLPSSSLARAFSRPLARAKSTTKRDGVIVPSMSSSTAPVALSSGPVPRAIG